MLAFIHAHSSEEITLSDIASSSLLGEREALRCFRRTINENPIRYLMKYRLMKSADRLLNKRTLSIGEIASLGLRFTKLLLQRVQTILWCNSRRIQKGASPSLIVKTIVMSCSSILILFEIKFSQMRC